MTIKEQLLDYIAALEISIYVDGSNDPFLLSELKVSLEQLEELNGGNYD